MQRLEEIHRLLAERQNEMEIKCNRLEETVLRLANRPRRNGRRSTDSEGAGQENQFQVNPGERENADLGDQPTNQGWKFVKTQLPIAEVIIGTKEENTQINQSEVKPSLSPNQVPHNIQSAVRMQMKLDATTVIGTITTTSNDTGLGVMVTMELCQSFRYLTQYLHHGRVSRICST